MPEAVLNSRAIAERCNVDFTTYKSFPSAYKIESGLSPDSFREELARKGMHEKFGSQPPDIYMLKGFKKRGRDNKKIGYSLISS